MGLGGGSAAVAGATEPAPTRVLEITTTEWRLDGVVTRSVDGAVLLRIAPEVRLEALADLLRRMREGEVVGWLPGATAPLLVGVGPVEGEPSLSLTTEDTWADLPAGTRRIQVHEQATASVIAPRGTGFRACYEQRLRKNADLAGRVELGWTVRDGRVVGGIRVLSDSTGDPKLVDCLAEDLRSWTFPPEVTADLYFPFLFQPAPP